MAEKIKTEDIIEFLVNAKELVALGKYFQEEKICNHWLAMVLH